MFKEAVDKVQEKVRANPFNTLILGLLTPGIIFLGGWIWDTNAATVKQGEQIAQMEDTTKAQWRLLKELSDKVDDMRVTVAVQERLQMDIVLPRVVIGEVGSIKAADFKELMKGVAKEVIVEEKKELDEFVKNQESQMQVQQKGK